MPPGAMPVAVPVPTPIVATVPSLLTHVPPPGALLSVVEIPAHILSVPLIADGFALTVTVVEVRQPEPIE